MVEVKECPACGSSQWDDGLSVADFRTTKEEFRVITCSSCGLKATSPRPEDDRLGHYYPSEEYISHSNKAKGVLDGLYKLARMRSLALKEAWLRSWSGGSAKKLLDYGAGNGAFLHHCQSKGWQVLGVEMSATARAVAAKDFGLELLDPAEAKRTEWGASMDIISLWHVLEHLPDLDGHMQFFANALVQGGKLVVAVPNPYSQDAEKYRQNWAAYDVPLHLWHFSKESLDQLAATHGLVRVHTRGLPFDAYYISMLSEKKAGSAFAPIRGMWHGFLSNMKARRTGQWSSLVHVFEKR